MQSFCSFGMCFTEVQRSVLIYDSQISEEIHAAAFQTLLKGFRELQVAHGRCRIVKPFSTLNEKPYNSKRRNLRHSKLLLKDFACMRRHKSRMSNVSVQPLKVDNFFFKKIFIFFLINVS